MIMFDAYNTPALAPVEMTDAAGAALVAQMATQCPVYVRAFQGPDAGDNTTVFWTTTPHGEVGTVFEHTRHNAFNVPMAPGDRAVEALRRTLEDTMITPTDGLYDGYAVGE